MQEKGYLALEVGAGSTLVYGTYVKQRSPLANRPTFIAA